ncbi:MAG: hypothetical protein K0S70_2208 [Microbacterium sp.]|jgi:hypothetical protein|nr:hypothetical protein [Microbacterium sp.]
MTTSVTIEELGLSIRVDDPEALAVLHDAMDNLAIHEGNRAQDVGEAGIETYGNDAFDMIEAHQRRQAIARTILAGIKAATTT